MSALVLLVIISLAVAGSFLGAFLWAVRSGQFDDSVTPSMRMLTDDAEATPLKIKQKTHGENPDE